MLIVFATEIVQNNEGTTKAEGNQGRGKPSI
jgi:hypothetical protein